MPIPRREKGTQWHAVLCADPPCTQGAGCGKAQYGIAQDSTIQYSTVQHSTVQYTPICNRLPSFLLQGQWLNPWMCSPTSPCHHRHLPRPSLVTGRYRGSHVSWSFSRAAAPVKGAVQSVPQPWSAAQQLSCALSDKNKPWGGPLYRAPPLPPHAELVAPYLHLPCVRQLACVHQPVQTGWRSLARL